MKRARKRWRVGSTDRLGMFRRARGSLLSVALAGALVAGLAACDDPPTLPGGEEVVIPLVLVGQLDVQDWPTDDVQINDPIVENDTLRMTLSFGGGCREHYFHLIVSTAFLESEPVQARSLLAHDANGDLCRAIVGGEALVDLSPLKQEWQKAYQAADGTIVLRLEEGPEIRYSFP